MINRMLGLCHKVFVTQSLCDRLNLHGLETQLLLTTIQEKNVLVESNQIFGLEVLDYHKEHVIKLPMAFTHEVVPVNKLSNSQA